MLHREVWSVLMDSVAIAAFIRRSDENRYQRPGVDSQCDRAAAGQGRRPGPARWRPDRRS